jgi:large subunit ribosomal protein L22
MKATAVTRYIRLSPRKARLVMDQIRGKKVEDALNLLSFIPPRSADIIKKLIQSAVANAQQNSGIDVDNLYIEKVFADQGPILKRFRPRAMGRAARILKRTSHLTVVLDEKRNS